MSSIRPSEKKCGKKDGCRSIGILTEKMKRIYHVQKVLRLLSEKIEARSKP